MLRIGKDLGRKEARPEKAKAALTPSRRRPTNNSSAEATQSEEKAPKHQRKADPFITQVTVDRATGGQREARASDTEMRTDRKGSIHNPIRQYVGQPHTAPCFIEPESVIL